MDFIAKFTLPKVDNPTNETKQWTIQTDSSLAQKRRRVGIIIVTPDGEMLRYGVQLTKHLKLTKHLAQEFDKLEFMQVPRGQNMAVDEIAKLASSEEWSTSMELNMEV